jgi:hypothetical protein
MTQLSSVPSVPPAVFSPLMLSDRLIALAQAADDAGYTGAAEQLVSLAFSVLDTAPTGMDWLRAPLRSGVTDQAG